MEKTTKGRLFWVLYAPLGLWLLAWPVLFYLTASVFDSPRKNDLEWQLRYLMVYAVWLYPIAFTTGLNASLSAIKNAETVRAVALPAALPLCFMLVVLFCLALSLPPW
ncbi:hypothetical protein [Geomesophilobacter sediminis]|uniref:Uncharacterized protein n=1 Tax=Geomesophilobacter sediminis TaxID=2798584 RepID=A0A8J7LUB8_9BACT|nr:hypothetical protein [Geomesophilobacter sediminis]MBJ6723580.1 hypothetical protein [Geomesophilobacter sediminis]